MKLSVIVPTFNEEAVIEATLRRAIEALAPCELIVADGCSRDGTVAKARPYAAVLTLEMTRGAALNHAAAVATGDVLLFLHADTIPPLGAAPAIEGALRDADVVGGAFRLRFDHPGRLVRSMASLVNLRSSLLNAFFGDQALFVRRDVFIRAGGFRDWSLMEDLEILARLRPHGRLALLDEEVVTSARRHRGNGWVRTIGTVWIMTFLQDVVVPHFHLFGWLLGITEVTIGASLVLGAFTRAGALLGVLQSANLLIAQGRTPEGPRIYLAILAANLFVLLTPSNRRFSVDSHLAPKFSRSRSRKGFLTRVLRLATS